MNYLKLVLVSVAFLGAIAFAQSVQLSGSPSVVTGSSASYTNGMFNHVDAGIIQTSQVWAKSSVASGHTIDCLFLSANADSNNVHMSCPMRANMTTTWAATTQLIQASFQMHSGSAVSVVDSSVTAPTVATACTGEAMTWAAGSASMRFDVGSTCAGVSTAVITLPAAATNCWTCNCWNVGAPTHNIKQSACNTTTATITNYAETFATATAWVDGADIQCMCRGG